MKRRIAILSVTYAPYWGGAEVAIKEITDRLSGDFEFVMFTALMSEHNARRETLGAVDVHRVGHPKFFSKYCYIRNVMHAFARAHGKQPFDLVWAVLESYAGIAGMLIKRKYPEIPYVLTLQSGDSEIFWKLRTSWWKPIFHKVYSAPDLVTAISAFLAEQARKRGRTGRITVIPNGVDVAKFQIQNSPYQKNELKKLRGIQETEKIVMTTSRLVNKNGIDTLIEAMTYVNGSVKLLIIGAGKDEKKLKCLTKKLSLEKRVVFMGHINHAELPKYLAIADVFARPSRSEGLGNSFLEAMAVGVPVVGTPVGGIPDFLKDGETGLLCRVSDPKDCAEKINALMAHQPLRMRISEAGSRLVREKYDWDSIAQCMRSSFLSL